MRRILHMDMDAFFAAVEQKRDPSLVGKPVVIGGSGDPMKRGVVSTASYEARKFGVHSAMPLRTAYHLCPDCIFLPVDYEEYSRVSREVKRILRSFSQVMEDVGIDEAFLDISDIQRPPEEIAEEIKSRIKEELGLTCSIGIAPNKLLAKIASDMQKPDGLTIITESDVETRIWPLAARKLIGVGPKTEKYLRDMKITTIGEIAALSREFLIERFGNSFGNYLYEASRGHDDRPLVTHWEPKSASRETTFQKDVSDWQVLARTLAELTKWVAHDIKRSGYKGRTVTVKIKFIDFRIHTRSLTLQEPTDKSDIIRKAAFECLKKFDLSKKVRLIGVRMGNLEKFTP